MKNNFTEINEGGLHEENKFGGVPMGVGNNGQLNTVEENETINDKFVYSDRIKLTSELVSQFNLPRVLANKTAAEATKIINTKFEGRNSTIDNSTKKAMLDRIAEAQETVKQIEAQKQAEIAEALNINSTMGPEDQMNGEIPQGMEEFLPQKQMFLGGDKNDNEDNTDEEEIGIVDMINLGTTALDLGNTAFGKTGVDTSGATDVNPGNISVGSSAFSGAAKGALAGSVFGPLGTGVGAAIGGVAGLVGGGRAKKDALKAHQNFEIGQSNKLTSNFKYGGNMYNDGGYLNRFKTSHIEDNPDYQAQGPEGLFKTNIPRVGSSLPKKGQFYKESFNQMRKPLVSNEIGFKSKLNYNDPDVTTLSPEQLQENNGAVTARTFGPQPNGHYEGEMNNGSKIGNVLNKTGQYLKDNYGNILRYSPVAMNALQLHKLNKSGYDTVNPMINNTRYNPQYMDEKALVNQINAESNYAGNALANSSNGSMGTLRDNILASQLAKTKGLSDAYSRVAEVNRNENKTGQQFNLGIDEANIARRIAAEDKTAMNKGNWETNKSRLLGQIGTDLGNIGLEQERNNMAEAMTGYTRKGKYLYKDDGTRVSADELKSTINNTMSSVGITEKDGKYFDASGKELTSTDVLKMINSKNTTNQNRFGGYMLNGPFLNNRMIKRYK